MDRKSSNRGSPFFMDVTLRDGNQALRNPWDVDQKEIIFRQLLKLGVQGIEVGFAAASKTDFEACTRLARMTPPHVVVSSLSRAEKKEILKSWQAICHAPMPQIHIVLALSPHAMNHVLRLSPCQVKEKAIQAVQYAAEISDGRARVQFSAEHFGDCRENLDFVLEVFQSVLKAGANVINLPNTVERYRPGIFVNMVKKVIDALPSHVLLSVHNHNDLGMATATTVESYFIGVTQLEVALNGLGERAGNTNLFEVACALHNCDVNVPLEMEEIYSTAQLISEISGVSIYEKAPVIGEDVITHRSGIHQDGFAKTRHLKKGAYRAYDSNLVGRPDGERLGFTSQSGKSAINEILYEAGFSVSRDETIALQPILKTLSEESGRGELTMEEVVHVYKEMVAGISKR